MIRIVLHESKPFKLKHKEWLLIEYEEKVHSDTRFYWRKTAWCKKQFCFIFRKIWRLGIIFQREWVIVRFEEILWTDALVNCFYFRVTLFVETFSCENGFESTININKNSYCHLFYWASRKWVSHMFPHWFNCTLQSTVRQNRDSWLECFFLRQFIWYNNVR